MHLEAGLDNPLRENYELNMIKRGISHQLGSPPEQKLPITVDIMRKLSGVYDFSSSCDIAFWAALVLGFFGLLRKSSLLLRSASAKPDSCLVRGDVINLSVDSFVLLVRNSKTIQFGQRVLQIPYVACVDANLCPVRALLTHLTTSRLPADSSLFAFVSAGRRYVLLQSEFVAKLRAGISILGLNPMSYSGHSLRRGGCTLGFAAGLSVVDLKLRGDWKSAAFERYLHVPSAQVFGAARAMVELAAMGGPE
jgi:hypothetical protein